MRAFSITGIALCLIMLGYIIARATAGPDPTKIETTPAVIGTLQGIVSSDHVKLCQSQGWPDDSHCNAPARATSKLVAELTDDINASK